MTDPKSGHLHIRWGEQDEWRLQNVMRFFGDTKADAVRRCVHALSDGVIADEGYGKMALPIQEKT